jgi:gliding motility-associated-like protein
MNTYQAISRGSRKLILPALSLLATQCYSQLSVNSAVSASQMVSALIGQGATVSNVVINCAPGGYGTFTNSGTNLGINNGIILTTGQAYLAVGPDNNTASSYANGYYYVDPDLTAIEPLATNDPCIMEFDIIPQCNQLSIRFVFGSEEYPEFVNASFNDAFGFFITGPNPSGPAYNSYNIALLPNGFTPVSIDNVNGGYNWNYYVNNAGGSWVQYDGFTTVLTSNVNLVPCQSYHFKMAIADANDGIYDSGVFIDYLQCYTVLSASTSSTPAACSACNGSASVSVANNLGTVSYQWSPAGGNGPVANGLCPGTYTVTVSDAYSCINPVTQVVNVSSAGAMSSSVSSQDATCYGGTGSATVTVTSGTFPFTYSWSSGHNTATASGLPAGNYTCTVTDASGCQQIHTVTINQPQPISPSPYLINNVSCSGGNNGQAGVFVSGGSGSYGYTWSPAGGNGSTASGLPAGTYTCYISDTWGCQTSTAITVSEPSPMSSSITSTPINCNGAATGSATVNPSGGNGSYSYSWSPAGGNGATAAGLTAGTYNVTILDGNGCSTSNAVTITEPPALSVTASSTNTSCGGSTGTATVNISGGTAGYGISWSDGQTTATASGLSGGVYSVTVTDALGCQAVTAATINNSNGANVSVASATNISCNGSSDGAASVSVSGGTPGYSYSWSPVGGNGASASGLPAGNYIVTVTDGSGCVSSVNFTLTEPAAINPAITSSAVSCFGGNNGTAAVNASGGNGNYTYSWSNGSGASSISNLAAGQYCVTVTDGAGCTASACTNVSQSAALTLTAQGSATICIGQAANVSCAATGGTPGYNYTWMPGSMSGPSAPVSPSSTTTYTAIATDANGCQSPIQTVTVNVNPPLSITASNNSSVCAGTSATLSANASGGDGNYTYLWSPTSSSSPSITVTPVTTTTYVVQVTDACGSAAATATVVVTVNQPSTTSILSNVVTGCASLDVSFTNTTTGACASQVWYFGDGSSETTNNPIHTYTTAGTYNVSMVCTDANGCIDSVSYASTIVVNDQPQASFTVSPSSPATMPVVFCATNTSISGTNYQWSVNGISADTTQDFCYTPQSAGTYCIDLAVTAPGGCADTTEQCLVAFDEVTMLIPNVFSPNGDGNNDQFHIKNTGLKELDCGVFDRWGLKVADFHGVNAGWDGFSLAGVPAQDGVYYYMLTVVTEGGEMREFHGYFHLLRK